MRTRESGPTCDISPVKYTSACLPESMDPPEPAQMAIVRMGDKWDSAYPTWTEQGQEPLPNRHIDDDGTNFEKV